MGNKEKSAQARSEPESAEKWRLLVNAFYAIYEEWRKKERRLTTWIEKGDDGRVYCIGKDERRYIFTKKRVLLWSVTLLGTHEEHPRIYYRIARDSQSQLMKLEIEPRLRELARIIKALQIRREVIDNE